MTNSNELTAPDLGEMMLFALQAKSVNQDKVVIEVDDVIELIKMAQELLDMKTVKCN